MQALFEMKVGVFAALRGAGKKKPGGEAGPKAG